MIVLTRPRAESEKLAEILKARGFETFIEPMLEIVFLDVELPALSAYDGLVFTSANGVHAFAEKNGERDLPVRVVGPATAEAARGVGFENVSLMEAGRSLTRLRCAPPRQAPTLSLKGEGEGRPSPFREREGTRASGEGEGIFLHICGEHVAREVEGADMLVLYRAEQSEVLSPACLELIDNKHISAVSFFSPRTAEGFVSAIKKHGRSPALRSIKALCIADTVVKCLSDLPWQDIITARTPDMDGFLTLLNGLAKEDNNP